MHPPVGIALVLLALVQATAPRSGLAEVNGTRLYYETAGSGPAVVLLHGGNLDSRMWDDQVPFLAKSFTVLRYDIRPYGRSAPTEKGFSSVGDLAALLDHLGIRRATLVGLSLGGRIAIDFALAHPDRVHKLVVMGPGLTGYAFTQNDEALKAILARARAGDAAGAMDLWLEHPMMAPAMARPAVARRIREIARDNLRIWSALPVGERVPAPPAIERLADIRVSTLLIVGERDVADIHAIVKLLAASVPGARTEVIPGAGHMPNMEDPERVNRLLAEFLGIGAPVSLNSVECVLPSPGDFTFESSLGGTGVPPSALGFRRPEGGTLVPPRLCTTQRFSSCIPGSGG